ncbi:SCA7, zinc-binding domain-containing protein [Dendryphion nanum]|uniref:SCA7, zinc-binding domain-containing protein n=1 Tax=Dendryphion nanum TaxID=256645 RepID=A0A9P9DT56_9PLEO|nr:SCA7, zinc-binding domain-containing protein [Dendryphion nanum]
MYGMFQVIHQLPAHFIHCSNFPGYSPHTTPAPFFIPALTNTDALRTPIHVLTTMAANGARKAPSTPSSAPRTGTFDHEVVKGVLKEKDTKTSFKLKIKKPAPKSSIPGNWKESEATNIDSSKAAAADPDSTSPIVKPSDEKIRAAFPTGRPLNDKVDLVQCKHCRRPVNRSAAATHTRDCLNKKQEKLKKKKEAKEAKDAALRKEKGEKDDDEGGKNNARKSAIKGAVIDGDSAKKGKKRKIDADAEKAPNAKKKKKDEPKAKPAKTKGPVDVERQCGVLLPNGGYCARSLTCKSHSMGLKRAVPGRSLPYDMLLAQYQKKNQAKQQRAAIDANAPLPEDLEPSGAVDSDEEKEQIMAALSRYKPRPTATYTHISQRSKYQYIRMTDMFRSALGGSHGGSIFGSVTPSTDNIGTARGLALGMMGAPNSASTENFPGSAGGMGSFPPPLSAGLDGPGNGINPGSRRQSGIGMGAPLGTGPRQILPGQLPGPGPQQQRKGSVASVSSMNAS